MKKRYILSLLIASCALTSCFHKDKPNYQYMADTDMYFPVGYETYQEAPQGNQALKNGMEAQLPPEHTIKRGWMTSRKGLLFTTSIVWCVMVLKGTDRESWYSVTNT